MKRKSSDFIELYNMEWTNEVSSNALTTLEQRKWNNPKRLPLADDLKLVNMFLKGKSEQLCASVSESANSSNWKELAEVSLAQLVLFNRRRGGESERLQLAQYRQCLSNDDEMQEEVASALSQFELQLAKTLKRIEIRGKKGRKVPVLITEDLLRNLNVLVENRGAGEVDDENPFMFARSGQSQTPIRGSDVIRKFAVECGAKSPQLITSTNLRKHVATVSQILNLKENELDLLANFLGHDIRIHRSYYRLPESTLQIAQVSKLLLHVEAGDLHKYKGKSLDEIHVGDAGK